MIISSLIDGDKYSLFKDSSSEPISIQLSDVQLYLKNANDLDFIENVESQEIRSLLEGSIKSNIALLLTLLSRATFRSR